MAAETPFPRLEASLGFTLLLGIGRQRQSDVSEETMFTLDSELKAQLIGAEYIGTLYSEIWRNFIRFLAYLLSWVESFKASTGLRSVKQVLAMVLKALITVALGYLIRFLLEMPDGVKLEIISKITEIVR